MARRLIWVLALAAVIPMLGVAGTSATSAAGPAVTSSSTTINTGAGPRPLHMIRITPGRGVRLETVWLGGGPGRTGTVGGYISANARRGAVAGLNGDFFLLARNVPSGNLLVHGGRSFLGNTECTPGYYNNEGAPIGRRERLNSAGYPKGPVAYFRYIEAWRSSGKFEGLEFR